MQLYFRTVSLTFDFRDKRYRFDTFFFLTDFIFCFGIVVFVTGAFPFDTLFIVVSVPTVVIDNVSSSVSDTSLRAFPPAKDA